MQRSPNKLLQDIYDTMDELEDEERLAIRAAWHEKQKI